MRSDLTYAFVRIFNAWPHVTRVLHFIEPMQKLKQCCLNFLDETTDEYAMQSLGRIRVQTNGLAEKGAEIGVKEVKDYLKSLAHEFKRVRKDAARLDNNKIELDFYDEIVETSEMSYGA